MDGSTQPVGSDPCADDGASRTLFVPADVGVRLGRWGAGDAVLVERLRTRQRWTVSRASAAVLLAFAGGRTREDAVESLGDILGASSDGLLPQIEAFIAAGLLTATADSPDPMGEHWRQHGWTAAYDHHQATWDYPLVDYTADGQTVDRARMTAYHREKPDPGPVEHSYCSRLPTSMDLTESAQAPLTAPAHTVLDCTDADGHLDASTLRILLAKTFCFTNSGRTGKTRRTSPSGGARHPAEGYAITQGVTDMPNGVWHVDASGRRLVRVPGTVSPDWTRKHLDGLYLAPFTPQALVIVTAVFSRNMYRYREPRTFRTVFMDVGHLLGTLETVADALGIRSFVHHAIDEAEVERMLGLSALREGIIAGAAVGGRP